MRYDVVLIGGGLSALVCGITLQKAGKRCLMVSAGQNALHFSSGSFGLLGRLPNGKEVTEPIAAVHKLGPEHPYSKIGDERVMEYAKRTPQFFADCGIELKGNRNSNMYRLTPAGTLMPCWLALKDTATFLGRDERIAGKVLVVNFAGYLDFNTAFLAEGLEKMGASVSRTVAVRLSEVERLRQNPSEMRSVNIARVMDREENWKAFAKEVSDLLQGEEHVVLPEVFGLADPVVADWLREMISAELLFVGTMPPSVPGIRMQMLLKKAFVSAGGTFLMGDEVLPSAISGGGVQYIRTANLGDIRLEADHFVLATGHFFGMGLSASPAEVRETVFGLEVDYPADRNDWYDKDFFARQEYLGFGVKTDADFHPFKDGGKVGNLFVIGAEAGGCNPLFEGCGGGVAIMTAFKTADVILNG